MSNKQLYIIGNGFDLFHDISSKYSDFRNYVAINDRKLLETLEQYFNSGELWSDFEHTLARLDTEQIVDDASRFLVSYGSDDWSEANHHSYQNEIQDAIDTITVRMKRNFTSWVLSLEIPYKMKLKLPVSAIYLNFNYTQTLEKIYNIAASNIVYIHNKAIDETSTLILGHDRQPDFVKDFNDNLDRDIRVAEGEQIMDSYFQKTYKDTKTIIGEQRDFFSNLSKIEEVFVLGHSISNVDIEYFRTVKEKVDKNATWKVSYYTDMDKTRLQKSLIKIGIDAERIEPIKLTDL